MKVKRGRPIKYDFQLSVGEVRTFAGKPGSVMGCLRNYTKRNSLSWSVRGWKSEKGCDVIRLS